MAETKEFSGGMVSIRINNPIGAALSKLPREVQEAIEKVVGDTSDRLFQRIQNDTPRDRGQGGGAVSKWTRTVDGDQAVLSNDAPHINVLEEGGYPVVADRRKKKKAKKKKAKKKKKKRAGKIKLKRPPGTKPKKERTGPGFKSGNATLGGFPPGPRTQVAPGGSPVMFSNVSRQAPSGMARQNLERIQPRFVFDLEEAIDEAFDEIAKSK